MADNSQFTYSQELALAVHRFGQLEIAADDPALWTVLTQIALSGLTCYPWPTLALLLAQKIDERLVILQSSSPINDFTETKSRIHQTLVALPGPPFTLQRLCELVVSPDKWGYSTTKRYVHAVEKVLTVTSYQETLSPEQFAAALAEQYDNMRAVTDKKRSGDEDLLVGDAYSNMGVQGSSTEEGLEESPGASTPAPHTDTPALEDESSALGQDLDSEDPTASSNIDASSRMDVDN